MIDSQFCLRCGLLESADVHDYNDNDLMPYHIFVPQKALTADDIERIGRKAVEHGAPTKRGAR